MIEKRKERRVPTELRVRWEGSDTRLEGDIVDLSPSGCFILTDDRVNLGELIRVEIFLPQNDVLYVWGEVVYQISEMGFAVRFTGAEDADLQRLRLHVKTELHRLKESASRPPRTFK